MASAPARPLLRVWFLKPFAWSPLPPLVIGLGIVVAVEITYVVMELFYEWLRPPAGGDTFWTRGDLFVLLPGALLLGYVPTGVIYGNRANERAFTEVRPFIRNSDAELEALTEQHASLSRRGFRLAGLVGALVWQGWFYLVSGQPLSKLVRVHRWDHYDFFSYSVNLLLFVMFAQVVYASVRGVTLTRISTRVSWDLDLLDLRPLQPLVRQGLTQALLWVIGITIVSLAFLEADRSGSKLAFQVATLIVAFGGAAAALLLPLRGVQRLITAMKRKEIDCLNAAIRGDRQALADSRLAGQARELSLADLIAYRDLVERVPEWLIESKTLLRLLLYLVIPLASWIGGALVERMLETLLS
jgi:hypothetical protein